jgi:hypothetical protein
VRLAEAEDVIEAEVEGHKRARELREGWELLVWHDYTFSAILKPKRGGCTWNLGLGIWDFPGVL